MAQHSFITLRSFFLSRTVMVFDRNGPVTPTGLMDACLGKARTKIVLSRFAFCSGCFLCKMLPLVPGPQHAHFVEEIGKGMIGLQSRWRNTPSSRSGFFLSLQSRWRNSHTTLSYHIRSHQVTSNHHIFGIFGYPGLHFVAEASSAKCRHWLMDLNMPILYRK